MDHSSFLKHSGWHTHVILLNGSSSRQVLGDIASEKGPSPAATMSYHDHDDPSLPSCCIECAQLYTMTYHQQSLETFLLSQNDSHLNPGRNNTNIDRISPDAGSSKSVSRGNLNDNDDPSITSVPTRSPRNSRKSGERHGELDIGIEYNPSVPAQKRLPSKRGGADSRQKTTTTNKPRKYNDDLPPLPTQHTHSSNGGPRVQYPQGTRALYSVDTPQAHVGSLSMSSVQRNQCTMYPQIRPQTQQPRGTHVSFSANSKPRDSEYVEPPSESVPIPEKRQSSFSQIRSESQPREARVSFGADKPRDPADHIEYPSVPIQEKNQYYFSHSQETQVPNNKPRGHVILPSVPKSQFNFSQTHFKVRPQETQASSNVNKSRDRPKASMPTQDQGQGPNASLASASKTDTRPHLLHGTPSQMDTQYVSMLLALDDIPTLYNILAGFFNWILLAGFILFPGTFTSLKNLGGSGQLEQQLVHVITSIPL